MIKRMIKVCFAVIAVILVAAFITACGGVDGDGDGYCDSCGARTMPKCNLHVDRGSDGLCDRCNGYVASGDSDECAECHASLVFTCGEHTDADGNGACDGCGIAIDGEDATDDGQLSLVKNGISEFQIVTADGLKSDVMKTVKSITDAFLDMGIAVNRENDVKKNVMTVEILIGDVTSRGEEYYLDGHSLGYGGSAITVRGTKLLVNAGDSATLLETVKKLKTDYLKLTDGCEEITNLTISEDSGYFDKITEYPISSIMIGDRGLSGRYIVYDENDSEVRQFATLIQEKLYMLSGNWLPLVYYDGLKEFDGAIVISIVEDAGEEGLNIYTEDDTVYISSEFINRASEEGTKFLNEHIFDKTGDIKLDNGIKKTVDVRNIYYKDFGAVGDGVTDDYLAIRDCHNYANIYGHTVVADDNATYYFGGHGSTTIHIKTNVKWGNARFIIDDSQIKPGGSSAASAIFVIDSDYTPVAYSQWTDYVKAFNEAGGIKKDEFNNIGFAPGYTAIAIPYDGNRRVYIRYGGNANGGSSQAELILVDKDGNVDPNTKLILDYTQVTALELYRADDKPITLDGGRFVTIANQAPSAYTYYNRGIEVNRSNVTIKGLHHSIEGELDHGAPYGAFIGAKKINNLLCLDCVLQGHRFYLNEDPSTGGKTYMGTYELGGSFANNLYYKNCIQSNFFTDETETAVNSKVWGVMGTNYCKNITYDSCTLNRLDAHAGVFNATVKNSNVKDINLIGGGTALIEDSKIFNNSFITLRSDYGSTWNGDVIIRNSNLVHSNSTPTLISVTWYNHDFGYRTYMPTTVTFDNVTYKKAKSVNVFGLTSYQNFTADTYIGEPNKNPMVLTQKIVVKNNVAGINYKSAAASWAAVEIPVINED